MSEVIDLQGFQSEVSAIAARLVDLQVLAGLPDAPAETVARTALDELQQTVEELRVSQEELSAQNEALTDSRHRLEEEHARYRALFQVAPSAYLVTDLRGVVTEANRAAIVMLNVDVQFLLGKPLVSFLVPAARSKARSRISEVATTGRPARGEWDVQPRRRPPLPSVFDVALLRASGRPESLLWLIRDLSTEKALANRANQLAARLVDQDDEDEQHEAAMQLAVNDLASLVLDQVSLSDVLTRVAEVAKTVLPGAAGASVSLFEQGRARVGGTSAPWVAALDERQYTLHEGPCVAALGDGTWHLSSNLDEDTRWLRFGTEATAQGVLSALAVPLLVRGARLGVLNVYGANRDAFPGRAVDDAKRIAETAAVVVANAQMLAASHRLAAELEEALLSRSGVDMAKGMLMARAGVDPDTAFEMLRDLSQRRHVKLRDLAAEMVRSTET